MKKKYSIISFWNGFSYENNIFTNNYFKNYELSNDYNLIDILIIGSFVSENEYNIIKKIKCYKILYISEPIEFFYNFTYKLYLENEYNMIYGCIDNNILNNKYKFPLYLDYFNYNSNIFEITNNYVKNCNINDKNFCCLINRHDKLNTRTLIYNKLTLISLINCPSDLFNNCSNEELNSIGNIEYIKKFKFNICPENCKTNINGYITEKLLNSCLGGAIPIYYGWFDEIDEKIFNKNRILFYDPNNEDSINKIYNKILYFSNNYEEFNNFYRQNIFKETAYDTIKLLENNLVKYFKNID